MEDASTTRSTSKHPLAVRRLSLAYSQAEVAEAIGFSENQISRWENGEHRPSFKARRLLAEFYGCTVLDILRDIDGPSARF